MSTTVTNGEETMWCGHCGVNTPTRHEGKAGSVKSCNWCGKVLADETGTAEEYTKLFLQHHQALQDSVTVSGKRSRQLTHEDRVGIIDEVCENPSNNVDDVANEDLLPGAADDQPLKKSKRARVAPPSLVSDYHCGSKKHKRARVEQIGFNPTSFFLRAKFTNLKHKIEQSFVSTL
ncbi:hypothetical protein Bca52824_073576 [Brassica carinata]|uniref:Uncharacterized protein n=1 Tax=Brassica carinata TaxID=52824 RepID=A0A8X7QAG2_BRACI|nr:hypothetical protein Bca52824_073576 [Brassica carinata]